MGQPLSGPPSPIHPNQPPALSSSPPPFSSLPPGPASPPLSLPLSESGRPLRIRRLPARYQDIHPEPPHPAASSDRSPPEHAVHVVPRVTLIVKNPFRTAPNNFGVWKEYLYRPSYDPDAFISPEDLYQPHMSAMVPNEGRTAKVAPPSVYSNKTTEILLNWQSSGSSKKSDEEVTRLVHSVLYHNEFNLEDLRKFNATREHQKADAAEAKFLQSFRHTSVNIDVPSGSSHEPSRMFSIPSLYHRQLTILIKEAFESPISSMFHLSPYKLFRKPPNSEDSEHLYSDIYDSDMLLDEHDKVQRAPTDDPTCKREKVVAALMFWSDATHLATFGTAKLWPIYMLFGNLSKYA